MTHDFAAGTVALSVFVLPLACSSSGVAPGTNERGGAGGSTNAAGAALDGGGRFSRNGSGGVFEGSGGPGSPAGTGGKLGSGGIVAEAGTVDGSRGTGGADAGTGGKDGGGSAGTGTCCRDGNCLCHGPDPTELTSGDGTFANASFQIPAGTIYYPTDAEPPFAAVVTCGGFTSSGASMAAWGPFYASHGIVMMDVTVNSSDKPSDRAAKLSAALDELKRANTTGNGPLFGKMSGRYGASGYSMCGGAATIASGDDPALETSVAMAAWGPETSLVRVPTLLLCGGSDTTAPCDVSRDAYAAIADSVPKMMLSIPGATHFSWSAPMDAGEGTSGKYALAFHKVFLEGDERWRPFLLQSAASSSQTTNIK